MGTEYKLHCIIVVSVGCGFDVNNNITIVHPSTYFLFTPYDDAILVQLVVPSV